MKFKLFIITAATLATTTSYADSSVTLYGVADGGIEYLNKAVASTGTVVPAAKGHDLLALQSGGQSGSRWGLRGAKMSAAD